MHKYRDPVERLHRERQENGRNDYPDIDMDPELRQAWYSLQLYWLAHSPGYRTLIRERVSSAARDAERLSRKIDKQHENVDYLGREIEGCG